MTFHAQPAFLLAEKRLATDPRLISFKTINFRQLHIYIFYRLQFAREWDASCYTLDRKLIIIIVIIIIVTIIVSVMFKNTFFRASIIRIIDVNSAGKSLDKICTSSLDKYLFRYIYLYPDEISKYIWMNIILNSQNITIKIRYYANISRTKSDY